MSASKVTRAELMRTLSSLSAEEVLNLLKDDTIFEIAERHSANIRAVGRGDSMVPPYFSSPDSPLRQAATSPSTVARAKRPLNAFMAFRSYYLKLFPAAQQKTASGFLTTLWNKDPSRNQWALVAKVYSFVRDEIGKDKVSLGAFLGLACPIMRIIDPATYLTLLGWSVGEDETGAQKMVQDEETASIGEAQVKSMEYPDTENELLSLLIGHGYLPRDGSNLLQRMAAITNGIMMTGAPNLPPPRPKTIFINTIQADPIEATRQLFGTSYDDSVVRSMGVNSHRVADVNMIDHLPMRVAHPDPREFYNYANTGMDLSRTDDPALHFDGFPDHQTFDVDNPFDMDAMLGFTQEEGERTAGLPRGPEYDPSVDFHYGF